MIMPITYTDRAPGPNDQTQQADGQASDAPVDMSAACEQAATAAEAHCEQEAGKVAMGM